MQSSECRIQRVEVLKSVTLLNSEFCTLNSELIKNAQASSKKLGLHAKHYNLVFCQQRVFDGTAIDVNIAAPFVSEMKVL